MNTKRLKQSTEYTNKLFSNSLFATQLLIIMYAIKVYFLNGDLIDQNQIPHLFSIRLDMLLYAASLFLIIPTIKRYGKYDFRKATVCYFSLIALLVVVIAFTEGGLYSVSVMGMPIIAIFSALYTPKKVFFSISTFFSSMIIMMAVNHHNGWFQGTITSGSMRLFDFLVIIFLSAFVVWAMATHNKRSKFQRKLEHEQIVESKILIQHLADTDSLTGLANRSNAIARFETMQTDLDPLKEEIGLYFIDLDNFKSINDIFDHHMGDELLKIIAKRLGKLVDSNAVVCRLGGDEFALFIKACRPYNYERLAKQILASLSEPHIILGTQAEVTASIGITVINDSDISFDNARKQADMAMYKSKESGKNDYHFYSEDLHRDYMKNLTMLNELKDALNKEVFDLHFQPKVDIKTSKVIGAEALLRWNRDNPNNFTPGEFIPIIESTELIHSIGAWVLEKACIACKHWHQNGHYLSISVNVSAFQLARNGFYEIVVEALSNSGLPAIFLEIELTEHILLKENSTINSQLSNLKKLGVKLAIDDFGTGYSNMSYLTRLEVDTLKLDRSFISEIEKSRDSLAIVVAINEMACVLGMSLIAEGVEKESERKLLENMGCEIGQGFLWSKALPSDLLLEYLKPKTPKLLAIY